VSGVYPVLQGIQAGNPLMGGWGYLQWTGEVYHEALDLNSMGGGDADLGALVVAPLDGFVTDVMAWGGVSTGFGNHLAMYIDDERAAPRCYMHVAHLQVMSVAPGQRVVAGQQLGTCGKSGNQGYAHVHAALWYDTPPGGWGFWQTGYSREWVAERTVDPQKFFWDSVARAQAGPTPPVPQEVYVILNGAQQAAIQAALWGAYWDPGAADHALPSAWREEWKAGRYRGLPTSSEQEIPASEDKPAGRFQTFELGIAAWLPGEAVSWNG
jgi:hypothetical protein